MHKPWQQVRPKSCRLIVHHDNGGTRRPRKPHLLDARVVACARTLRHAVAGCKAEFGKITLDEVEERAVLDLYTLGLSRCT